MDLDAVEGDEKLTTVLADELRGFVGFEVVLA
jgi:hypothetical protein